MFAMVRNRIYSFWQKVRLMAYASVMVSLGIPTTLLIPLVLTTRLFKRFRHERFLTRIHGMEIWARFCLKRILRTNLDVRGKENVPLSSRGHLYICNHQSFVDIPALTSALGTVAFLAKESVKRYPLIGRCAHAGGSIFVNCQSARDRRRALEETIRMCRNSTAVVVFPEGRLSPDGSLLQKVHLSCVYRAHRMNLKVIPIGLHGTWDVIPSSLDRVSTGQHVAVRIGEAINPRDIVDPQEFAQACWSRVQGLHADARRWVDSRKSTYPQLNLGLASS